MDFHKWIGANTKVIDLQGRRQVYWRLPFRAELEYGSRIMSMRDIDLVIAEVERYDPNIRSWQLEVKHPSDDDGIWFFWIPEVAGEVQVSTSMKNSCLLTMPPGC